MLDYELFPLYIYIVNKNKYVKGPESRNVEKYKEQLKYCGNMVLKRVQPYARIVGISFTLPLSEGVVSRERL